MTNLKNIQFKQGRYITIVIKQRTIAIRLNKNRKKSMQQLKKIANEEIKSFLSLPVKTIPLHKKSSKNFQHLGSPFDGAI